MRCLFAIGLLAAVVSACADDTQVVADAGDAGVGDVGNVRDAGRDIPFDTGDTPFVFDRRHGAPPRDACEYIEVNLKPDSALVPHIMLVVDRSGSMRDSGEWDRMVPVLEELTAALDDVVHFGLTLFPDPRDPRNSCAPGRIVVEPDARTADQIELQFFLYGPSGGTPTAESLVRVYNFLEHNHPESPNLVILATDGGPGCNMDLEFPECTCIPDTTCLHASQNCLDDGRTVSVVEQMAAADVPSYVIGIPGSERVTDVLDRMAVAGGTDRDGRHISVSNPEELTEALRSVAGGVVPCRYELGSAPDNPDHVALFIDGIEIARDQWHRDGWDISDERFVDMYGFSCRRIRDGNEHVLEVRYNCGN